MYFSDQFKTLLSFEAVLERFDNLEFVDQDAGPVGHSQGNIELLVTVLLEELLNHHGKLLCELDLDDFLVLLRLADS